MRHHAVVLASAALALALPAAAGAHVSVQPDELAAGSSAVIDVRVPNEKQDRGTVKVELQLPPGVSYAAYQPIPNWTASISKRVPVEPLVVEGEAVDQEIDTITWTGKGRAGVIAPGQFLQFPVSLRVPDGAEGTSLVFKALQTYEGGEVVRWIGAADGETPAPTVTLEEPEDEHGGAHRAAGATPPASSAGAVGGDDEDGDAGDAVPIALGAAGLLAGLAGLGLALAGRRRRT